jgi:hypothetical protein
VIVKRFLHFSGRVIERREERISHDPATRKTKKELEKDTLAEVTKEMAKPRVAMSARITDTQLQESLVATTTSK